jgi:phosphopantothenoylcysteine decarboxylase/phosphopantothenate--cysteine ligase
MARILLTSGPTREYLDPVRYLSNASSGRMGRALAAAAMAAGHEVVIVSGPVEVDYSAGAEVIRVVSTQEMLDACLGVFARCDGVIGVAAPCDYRPAIVSAQKLSKTGRPLRLELVETPDIVAALAAQREKGDRSNLPERPEGCFAQIGPVPFFRPQWIVAFALETGDGRARALKKLQQKQCDLIVHNGPEAIHGDNTEVEVLDPSGNVLASLSGAKGQVAEGVFRLIEERLIRESRCR